ncbi:MAG: CBS domain-containing protein [Oscillospiraceae bacterium]|nr:CBS domain-containing protein [Oscillospiraceae bacterium]
MNIAKILTPRATTALLHASDTVRQGLEIMRRHGYTAIPVLDEDEKYIGSVTEGDFLRHMMEIGSTDLQKQEKYYIYQILRKEFCKPLGIMADERQVIDSVLRQNYVPIVDDRGCLCGIVTRRSVIAYLAGKETQCPEQDKGLDEA